MAQSNQHKPPGDAFLRKVDAWHRSLARNMALRNPGLPISDLNAAARRTLVLAVFLRMAEDRCLEPPGQLRALSRQEDLFAHFAGVLCPQAGDKYNCGLFQFRDQEDAAEQPDRIGPRLTLDDDVFRAILNGLCETSIIPARTCEDNTTPGTTAPMQVETLGAVYERLLGKTVRASGGVYYTPSYIVEYIVNQTVKRRIEGRSPAQLADGNNAFRILDMACGSGAFLLGAYQCLLDHALKWYVENDPAKFGDAVCPTPEGGWRLTLAQRQRILTTHVFGLDVDPEAAELTRLSLLLTLVEGVTSPYNTIPDLSLNILCRNALAELLPADLGRFACVIGNPPYRRELDYKPLLDQIAETAWGAKYRTPRMDLWYYFLHRGLELLQPGGVLSFIVNSYWTAGTGADKLIAALREEAHVDEIFSLGKLSVFPRVAGQHMVIRVTNAVRDEPATIKLAEGPAGTSAEEFVRGVVSTKVFTKRADQLFRSGKVDLRPSSDTLLARLDRLPHLETLGRVRQGIAENPASINRKTNARHGGRFQVGEGVFALRPQEAALLRLSEAENKLLRPYHDLCDLGRYWLSPEPSLRLIYSTPGTCPDIERYPGLRDHLARFQAIMAARRETRKGTNRWWHLHWPRDEAIWKSPKILSLQMGRRPAFVSADDPVYVPFSVNVFVPGPGVREHLHYLAGLLNSRLMWTWFDHHAKRRGAGLEINGNVLQKAPIRRVDFSEPADIQRHDRLAALVERRMCQQQAFRRAGCPADRVVVQRQINAAEREIDQLVYELYGLADEEVEFVEQATS
jgi:SAM-dependent methyltransferase